MKTLEWTTVDKSKWGRGPWDGEPDKKQWQDEVTGLPCLAVRNPSGGNWCGYVGIPKRHPLHGVGYSDEVPILGALLEARKARPVGENPSFAVLIGCLSGDLKASPDVVFEVHGGLTFSGGCKETDDPSRFICYVPDSGEPDDVWWFGFDCAHSGDVSPGYDRFFRDADAAYRTLAYVEGQVAELARQLKEVSA